MSLTENSLLLDTSEDGASTNTAVYFSEVAVTICSEDALSYERQCFLNLCGFLSFLPSQKLHVAKYVLQFLLYLLSAKKYAHAHLVAL
jgi:hypothetical protein